MYPKRTNPWFTSLIKEKTETAVDKSLRTTQWRGLNRAHPYKQGARFMAPKCYFNNPNCNPQHFAFVYTSTRIIPLCNRCYTSIREYVSLDDADPRKTYAEVFDYWVARRFEGVSVSFGALRLVLLIATRILISKERKPTLYTTKDFGTIQQQRE